MNIKKYQKWLLVLSLATFWYLLYFTKLLDSFILWRKNFKSQNYWINLYFDGNIWNRKSSYLLNGIKVRVFFENNIEKRPLYRHDKNYYYFDKSNIPVINLISGSRNVIKVSKSRSFEKINSTTRVVFTKYQQLLSVFYYFWVGQNCNG